MEVLFSINYMSCKDPYLDIIALFRRIISVDSTDTSRYATESCIRKQSFALDMTLISINPLWQHFKILGAINWIFTWSLLSSWISTNLTRSSSRVWWRKYKEGCAWCDILPLVNPKSSNSELGLFVESHAVTGNSFAIFFIICLLAIAFFYIILLLCQTLRNLKCIYFLYQIWCDCVGRCIWEFETGSRYIYCCFKELECTP